MRLAWVCVIGAASGCVEVGVQHCENGTVCPAGTTCGTPSGCIATGDCGDGVRAGDEACDDGNTAGGDGCSADCRSTEVCGNSIVDEGEECDDNNLASHDGCSSGCLVEQPAWTALTSTGPSKRRYGAVAWDPDRGRAVLAGGDDPSVAPAVLSSDTWYFARRQWMAGPALPGPLTAAAMASDGRGTLLLTGGEDGTGCAMPDQCTACMTLGDDAWTPTTPLDEGRQIHVLVQAPGTVLLFGGDVLGADPATWNNGVWVSHTTTLSSRRNAMAAFDPYTQTTYIVGGITIGANETLTWDGSTFTTTSSSLQRFAGVMAYDVDRRALIAFGGQQGGGFNLSDVLEGRGGSWTPLAVSGGPFARYGAAGFYDPIEHGLVVFGGNGFMTVNVSFDDTWLLRWESATPDEKCDRADADSDGAIGCDDPDCWARCTPRCPPGTICPPDQPRCGDGTCNSYLEDAALCPADC